MFKSKMIKIFSCVVLATLAMSMLFSSVTFAQGIQGYVYEENGVRYEYVVEGWQFNTTKLSAGDYDRKLYKPDYLGSIMPGGSFSQTKTVTKNVSTTVTANTVDKYNFGVNLNTEVKKINFSAGLSRDFNRVAVNTNSDTYNITTTFNNKVDFDPEMAKQGYNSCSIWVGHINYPALLTVSVYTIKTEVYYKNWLQKLIRHKSYRDVRDVLVTKINNVEASYPSLEMVAFYSKIGLAKNVVDSSNIPEIIVNSPNVKTIK